MFFPAKILTFPWITRYDESFLGTAIHAVPWFDANEQPFYSGTTSS